MATNNQRAPQGATVLRLIDCEKQRARIEADKDAERTRVAVSILKCLLHEAIDGKIARLTVLRDMGPGTQPECLSNTGNREEALQMALRASWDLTACEE